VLWAFGRDARQSASLICRWLRCRKHAPEKLVDSASDPALVHVRRKRRVPGDAVKQSDQQKCRGVRVEFGVHMAGNLPSVQRDR